MSDGERATLSIRKRKPETLRAELAQRDWENLVLKEDFLRTLFTILDTAGMYTGNFQPDQRTHAFLEGRRSLGLDILRTAERYLGPDAHLRILEAEKKTQQGGSSDRSGTDDDERTRELGSGDDLREPGTGLTYLDYGDEVAGAN